MKVGDIVRQSGKLVEFRGRGVPKVLGVVVSVESSEEEDRRWKHMPHRYTKWQSFLGRSVTVLWANDRMMSVAENALEVVVDESR